jgi:phage terminase large subunit-like protein
VIDPLLERLSILPDGWHESRLARIAATADDPLLFAYVYLRETLRAQTGVVSFSRVHEEWYEKAKTWMTPGPARDIYIAPRSMGKSSTWFLINTMWAAAHGHVRFVAAFSDSATQAEEHLRTFRHQLQTNERLREDFPHLTAFKVDNVGMLQTESFVFSAKGMDAGTLGLKVGNERPGVIILDDVEPGSNYSGYQVEKRLDTLTDVILPLNDAAKVILVGTAVMHGSLIHQAVMHDATPAQWIKDENFEVHYHLPFDDEGESIWPERWTTDYLRSIEHTRSFAKSFLSQPVTLDGEYWEESDYTYGDVPSISRRIIAVDPAVTTKRSSDETGIAVVGYSAAARKAVVNEAFGVRMKGEPLRTRILELLNRYPDVAEILWERNAGGEMMVGSVLHDMPVRVTTVHNSEKKEVRMERALSYYRRGAVLHARSLPALEAQQCEFPKGLHDDVGDACAMALDHLAAPGKKPLRAASR